MLLRVHVLQAAERSRKLLAFGRAVEAAAGGPLSDGLRVVAGGLPGRAWSRESRRRRRCPLFGERRVGEGGGSGEADRRVGGTGLRSREGGTAASRTKAVRVEATGLGPWRKPGRLENCFCKVLPASAGGAGGRGDEVVAAGSLDADVEQWSSCRAPAEREAG
jgi:hypothetical protein